MCAWITSGGREAGLASPKVAAATARSVVTMVRVPRIRITDLLAEVNGWTKFVSMQNHYNLLYREDERELIPVAEQYGMSLTPYSPLASGHLTRPTWDSDSTRSTTDGTMRAKYDAGRELEVQGPQKGSGGPSSGDRQVIYFEQAHRADPFRRGSRRSRRASPSRLKPSTVAAMASPGQKACRGAVPSSDWESCSMRPQEAAGGAVPRPR